MLLVDAGHNPYRVMLGRQLVNCSLCMRWSSLFFGLVITTVIIMTINMMSITIIIIITAVLDASASHNSAMHAISSVSCR